MARTKIKWLNVLIFLAILLNIAFYAAKHLFAKMLS